MTHYGPTKTLCDAKERQFIIASSFLSFDIAMDSAEFHAAVYHVVRQIPFGKATSYGHVAKLIGLPRHARHVGQALKFLNAEADVPWQRVVASSWQDLIAWAWDDGCAAAARGARGRGCRHSSDTRRRIRRKMG
ncbi:6-O-methylguanine DNA methyltransferase [Phellopilus nigrolimitatus]|nr:6-O-methylguanine DNA methyltransferase [Phellopilus nigrolimitatus]